MEPMLLARLLPIFAAITVAVRFRAKSRWVQAQIRVASAENATLMTHSPRKLN